MARKIRFPLKMTNGAEVRTVDELRDNFDLTAVLGYYADGKLVTWLRDRYLDSEADKIEALDKNSKSFQNDLCAALGVEISSDSGEEDGEFDEEYIKHRKEKLRILRDITEDSSVICNVDSVAFNQDDLLEIYDDGKKEIYLCQGDFEIPLSVTDVTYIGVANPTVIVRATDNVNFNEKNIKFVDCVYGWDISGTSALDGMKRAEHLFLSGNYQKAVSALEGYAEQGNPRAILLLCRFYENYMPDKNRSDYWVEKSMQSFEAANIIRNISRKDKQGIKKCLPSLKKLADREDFLNLFNYYLALNIEEENLQEEIKYLKLSAEKDYDFAQNRLGNCYYSGKGVAQDYAMAVEWYTKAAKQGYAWAQNNLGNCCYSGKGITQDYPKAVEWYTKAAEQGLADAQDNLGNCYYKGIGVAQDYVKAVEWTTKAAEQGIKYSQNRLGNCYYNGKGVAQDYAKAVEWYIKAAEQGHVWAQYNLADCYYDGEGTAKDYTKAVEWYTKAAEQGNVDSQFKLGCCYHDGNGVPQNYAKAVEWYAKAAEQGMAKAQNRLAMRYLRGEGVAQNYTKAVEWFKKAAEQGLDMAQVNLGDCYYNGQGVAQDYAKAVEWYMKAADQENELAQLNLGKCYHKGRGVSQNYSRAIYWYTKAADQYNSNASCILGCLYYIGEGVSRNCETAMDWLSGSSDKAAREMISKIMFRDINEPEGKVQGAINIAREVLRKI